MEGPCQVCGYEIRTAVSRLEAKLLIPDPTKKKEADFVGVAFRQAEGNETCECPELHIVWRRESKQLNEYQ